MVAGSAASIERQITTRYNIYLLYMQMKKESTHINYYVKCIKQGNYLVHTMSSTSALIQLLGILLT
jgi:hypothetical protein